MLLKSLLLVAATALLGLSASTADAQNDKTAVKLPILFLHGVTANAQAGRNLQASLAANGQLFTSLDFCQDLCSVQALNLQIPLAIAQIRNITANDARYDDGYVLIGHSQGGAIARGIVEEMDDHNVKVLVSLASAVNGGFNGPQPSDAVPLRVFVNVLGPRLLPATVFNFSAFSPADYSGKLQRAFSDLAANTPALQTQFSAFNLGRSPYFDEWVRTNPFFPVLNNVNVCAAGDVQCVANKQRRRRNFLRVQEAHFFASAADEVIAPWQQSHLGAYTDVASSEEIASTFASLKMLDATQTREYRDDTYGLQSLDTRGGLFFHTAQDVSHNCWVQDSALVSAVAPPAATSAVCSFASTFRNVVAPVFQRPAFAAEAKQPHASC